MADINVKAYIDQLRQALPYVPPVPVHKLKALHKKQDFGSIVRLIRAGMNVDVRLTLHWTSGPPPKGLEAASAWIELPKNMPRYGTPAFKELKLNIFILKSFAAERGYQEFAITVAHELSHVVLESIKHPLRKEEKAVDLTAMLLGFSYLYRSAAHTLRPISDRLFQRSQLGYLTEDELDKACKILVPFRMRAKRATLAYCKQSAGALVLLGVWGSAWAAGTVSSKWDAHQIAIAEERELSTKIPIRYSERMALIKASAGLISITRVFNIDPPPSHTFDLAGFERTLHKNVCAAKHENIKKGVSYYYEYQRLTGEPIAQFKINSCP
jgi:hypothetical protein